MYCFGIYLFLYVTVLNWWKTSYGFPKGKVNQQERPIDAATREVWEEIGFNIADYISEEVRQTINTTS
jgi:8-oxo-dGTP pyrophosphatase MutT (NUDIX family)